VDVDLAALKIGNIVRTAEVIKIEMTLTIVQSNPDSTTINAV
jgi:hypothetical protein